MEHLGLRTSEIAFVAKIIKTNVDAASSLIAEFLLQYAHATYDASQTSLCVQLLKLGLVKPTITLLS